MTEIVDRDHAHSMGTLPSLNERMSDEALDDCHAFSDLKEVIRQISRDHAHSSSGLGGSGNGAGAGLTAASSNGSGISSRSSKNNLSQEGSLAGGSFIGDQSINRSIDQSIDRLMINQRMSDRRIDE